MNKHGRFTWEEDESGKWPHPMWFIWDHQRDRIALDGRMFDDELDAAEAVYELEARDSHD